MTNKEMQFLMQMQNSQASQEEAMQRQYNDFSTLYEAYPELYSDTEAGQQDVLKYAPLAMQYGDTRKLMEFQRPTNYGRAIGGMGYNFLDELLFDVLPDEYFAAQNDTEANWRKAGGVGGWLANMLALSALTGGLGGGAKVVGALKPVGLIDDAAKLAAKSTAKSTPLKQLAAGKNTKYLPLEPGLPIAPRASGMVDETAQLIDGGGTKLIETQGLSSPTGDRAWRVYKEPKIKDGANKSIPLKYQNVEEAAFVDVTKKARNIKKVKEVEKAKKVGKVKEKKVKAIDDEMSSMLEPYSPDVEDINDAQDILGFMQRNASGKKITPLGALEKISKPKKVPKTKAKKVSKTKAVEETEAFQGEVKNIETVKEISKPKYQSISSSSKKSTTSEADVKKNLSSKEQENFDKFRKAPIFKSLTNDEVVKVAKFSPEKQNVFKEISKKHSKLTVKQRVLLADAYGDPKATAKAWDEIRGRGVFKEKPTSNTTKWLSKEEYAKQKKYQSNKNTGQNNKKQIPLTKKPEPNKSKASSQKPSFLSVASNKAKSLGQYVKNSSVGKYAPRFSKPLMINLPGRLAGGGLGELYGRISDKDYNKLTINNRIKREEDAKLRELLRQLGY